MACPYFFPTARLENNSWVIPPRLPIGDAYTGECRAGRTAFQPSAEVVRATCNVGYARESCGYFPLDAPADAVRFHIAEHRGELIRIQYVFEKDCWPRKHGMLDYTANAREFSPSIDPILAKQAAAFVESYLRRCDQALATKA